jgi:nonribosomal peptide synthetase DhbF
MGHESIEKATSALKKFPGLASVTIVEYRTVPGEPYLVAYVTPDDTGLDTQALHAHARRHLEGPQIPAAIVVLDELPVDDGGKLDHDALPAPDLNGLVPYHPAATVRQETLCGLFAEALGVPRCGVDADFFKLGGRSVDAMLLAGRISSELGARISMADLFRAPTPADMDRRMDILNQGK